MSNLRILLVEEDSQRADELMMSLTAADHSAVPVVNLEEAAEALFLEKFEAVLLGSGQTAESLATFGSALRGIETRQHVRIPIVSCSSADGRSNVVDRHIATGSSFSQLADIVAGVSTGPVAVAAQPGIEVLPVFEPDLFAEQCAGERELMLEILDLFSVEGDEELLAMAEALGIENFDRVARCAHKLKGSLGCLHAQQARILAQRLEACAKGNDARLCAETLETLEAALGELKARLAAFRETLQDR